MSISASLLSVVLCGMTLECEGRVVAIGDEWLLSDLAFQEQPSQTEQLAQNIADYFAPGGSGNFLAASNLSEIPGLGLRGVNGPLLAAHMRSLGHSWTVDLDPEITLENLSQYSGVFLAGVIASGPVNALVLEQYVLAGGSVLIMAGTGAPFNAASESAAWAPFLNSFGLGFGTEYFAVGKGGQVLDVPVVSSPHPLTQILESITWGNGQLALDLDVGEPSNAVAVRCDFKEAGGGPQGDINDVISTYNVPDSCAADTNVDGVVDVLDLLNVILGWGECTTCICLGDTNGDLQVDVSDLVEVLLGWGACPR